MQNINNNSEKTLDEVKVEVSNDSDYTQQYKNQLGMPNDFGKRFTMPENDVKPNQEKIIETTAKDVSNDSDYTQQYKNQLGMPNDFGKRFTMPENDVKPNQEKIIETTAKEVSPPSFETFEPPKSKLDYVKSAGSKIVSAGGTLMSGISTAGSRVYGDFSNKPKTSLDQEELLELEKYKETLRLRAKAQREAENIRKGTSNNKFSPSAGKEYIGSIGSNLRDFTQTGGSNLRNFTQMGSNVSGVSQMSQSGDLRKNISQFVSGQPQTEIQGGGPDFIARLQPDMEVIKGPEGKGRPKTKVTLMKKNLQSIGIPNETFAQLVTLERISKGKAPQISSSGQVPMQPMEMQQTQIQNGGLRQFTTGTQGNIQNIRELSKPSEVLNQSQNKFDMFLQQKSSQSQDFDKLRRFL